MFIISWLGFSMSLCICLIWVYTYIYIYIHTFLCVYMCLWIVSICVISHVCYWNCIEFNHLIWNYVIISVIKNVSSSNWIIIIIIVIFTSVIKKTSISNPFDSVYPPLSLSLIFSINIILKTDWKMYACVCVYIYVMFFLLYAY